MNILQQAQSRLRTIASNANGVVFGTVLSVSGNMARVQGQAGIVQVELEFGTAPNNYALHPVPGAKVEFGVYNPNSGFIIAASEYREVIVGGKPMINGGGSVGDVALRDVLDAIQQIEDRLNA